MISVFSILKSDILKTGLPVFEHSMEPVEDTLLSRKPFTKPFQYEMRLAAEIAVLEQGAIYILFVKLVEYKSSNS
jgi:hypothetical protein